ncbi:LPS-assembly protein LptD [candidate division CSSED10-310 bacterium]|uniref:LPS-assembly protein LptD n=1 Tax=candidate division CSSED10-310 bacterium TaxID=2855610 RepID=A0ABV6YUK5_UNCC1
MGIMSRFLSLKKTKNLFLYSCFIMVWFGFFIVWFSSPLFGADDDQGSDFIPPGAWKDWDKEKEKPTVIERELKKKSFMMDHLADSETPVYISAQKQEYRGKDHVFIYSGDVQIIQAFLSIRANYVELNTWTNVCVMEGDIEIHFDKDIITAQQGEINLNTREMHLEKCRGLVEPSLFFECEVLERLYLNPKTEQGRYYFVNAYFTPCNQLIPQWSMKSREVYAQAEKYMHLFGSTFLIHDLPLFWFPYWFYPIKTDRATGFLVPSFGFSSRDGFRIKNEFFWVLADNADVTLTHDYRGDYRNEGKVEFEYVLSENSFGSFAGRYIYEMKDPFTEEEIPEGSRDIYILRGFQLQRLPGKVTWTLKIDYKSDARATSVYGEDVINQAQSFTSSWANLKKNWSKLLMSLQASHIQSDQLIPNLNTALQHLPNLTVQTPLIRFKKSGFYYSIYTQASKIVLYDKYSYDESEDETVNYDENIHFEQSRFHIAPKIRLNIPKYNTWWQLSTKLELWYTEWSRKKEDFDEEFAHWDEEQRDSYWSRYNFTLSKLYYRNKKYKLVDETFWNRTYEKGDGLARETYKTSVTLEGPIFYRNFETEHLSKTIQRVKHTFFPGITYNYVPPSNQVYILLFDYDIDHLAPKEGITYFFKSNVIGRVYDPDFDRVSVRSLATFSISQTYDFRLNRMYNRRLDRYERYQEGNFRKVPEPTRIDYPYTDIVTRLEIFPSENLWFSGTTKFDPYFSVLQNVSLSFFLQLKKFYIRSGWGKALGKIRENNRKDDDLVTWDNIEYCYLKSGGQVSGHWGYMLNTYYNLHLESFHHANASLIYDAQCWGITMSFFYRQYVDSPLYTGLTEPKKLPYKDEYNFTITIHLKHVGEIGGYDYGEGGLGLVQ